MYCIADIPTAKQPGTGRPFCNMSSWHEGRQWVTVASSVPPEKMTKSSQSEDTTSEKLTALVSQ